MHSLQVPPRWKSLSLSLGETFTFCALTKYARQFEDITGVPWTDDLCWLPVLVVVFRA